MVRATNPRLFIVDWSWRAGVWPRAPVGLS